MHRFARLRAAVLAAACITALVLPACGMQAPSRTGRLTIITINDLHGRLDPDTADVEAPCGGIARLARAIASVRETRSDETLTVACGDMLSGRYFLQFNGRATCTAMNLLGIDVATLGNHEFSRGCDVLAAALRQCSFPIVAANLVPPPETPLAEIVRPAVVLERNGLRIGVLGIVPPDLMQLTGGRSAPARAGDMVAAAAQAAAALRRQGVDLVIALTHTGIERDRELARRVPDIDIVCGGHSHTVVPDDAALVVPRADAGAAIIVQAGAWGRYVGVLHVETGPDGIRAQDWDLLPIDRTISPAPEMVRAMNRFRSQLPPDRQVTTLTAPLDCRQATVRCREAAVGNLVCDIMRETCAADIALLNGGALRGDRVIPAGPLTTGDIETLLPFDEPITPITLTGAALRHALEHAASRLPDPDGGFLQVSGVRLTIDPAQPPRIRQVDRQGRPVAIPSRGQRITSVFVQGRHRSQHPLEPDRGYRVAVSSFLAGGGDGYDMLKLAPRAGRAEVLLREAVAKTLGQQPAISPHTDARIRILTHTR